MVATAAKVGFGTTIAKGDGAGSEVFTALGEVVDIRPPGLTRDVADATHHGSANRIREKIAGLRDNSPATIELNYIPGGTAWDALKASYDLDVPGNFKITFPNAETVIFPCLVTNLSPVTPLGDVMRLTAELTPTGGATWS